MGSRGRTSTVALIVILTLVLAPVPGAGSGALYAGSTKPIQHGPAAPVVLVHGLTCGGPSVWGARDESGHGLYARLLGAGYVAGRDLFVYDYPSAAEADYATLATVGLEAAVDRARAETGADAVDILTFGTGALVARYWVASHAAGEGVAAGGGTPACGGQAPLRNLVMVAPPNHGQFQADVLKVLYHTDRLVTGAGAVAGGPAGSTSSVFPEPPASTTEETYVAIRARDYQGLYADYTLETRLLGKSGSPPPGYDDWLLTEKRDVIERNVFGAQQGAGLGGQGLTRAYFELLSLRVGRQLYLASVVAAGRAPALPALEDLLSRSWRSEIVAYLKELLVDWGLPKVGQLWSKYRAGLGLSLAEMLTCLEPGGVAMTRLVPEYLSYPGVGAMPVSVTAPRRSVLCNEFLAAWEAREARGRAPASCYVTIAGDCPGPLGLTGIEVGPNDLTIEAASALTDPAAADTFSLGRGLGWAHGFLPTNSKMKSWAIEALGEPAAVAAAGGSAGGADAVGNAATGSGTATLWAPAYAALPAGSEGKALRLEVVAGEPAASGLDGLAVRAWVAVVNNPGAGAPVPLAEVGLSPTGGTGSPGAAGSGATDAAGDPGGVTVAGAVTIPARAPGQALVLGVRLAPDLCQGPGYLTMGRYLGRNPMTPFSFSVSLDVPEGDGTADSGQEQGQGDGLPPDQAAEPEQKPGEEPDPGSGSPADSGDGQAAAGEAEIVPTLEPPLISVVRVTKLTTDKREDRTYHAEWQWDFGDGERQSDPDPSHTTVTVTHAYAVPGSYLATATSVAGDGRVLRKLQWSVEATVAGMVFTFEAETIVEPVVTLTLSGPKKWVTGKPARFELEADVSWPPRTCRQVIQAYPGWSFDVVWEKPGRFEVRAAITVRQSYEFPDGQRITVYNTYVTVVPIDILTPGLTE